MKILFLSHRLPYPPTKGDKLRAFHILKHLSQRHQVRLLTLAEHPDELKDIPRLKEYCVEVKAVLLHRYWSRLKSLPYLCSKLSLTLPCFYSATFQKMVAAELSNEPPELIFVFSSAMAQYVALVKGIPKILDFVDVDSEKWLQYAKLASPPRRWLYRLEGNRLREYEREVSQQFDASTVVTDNEREIMQRFIPDANLFTVRNGIQIEQYPAKNAAVAESPNLLFIGGMFYFAYIDGMLHFYREILPEIRRKYPDVRLNIVGANPARCIRRLSRDPQVEVTGFVPDVKPYLQKATVYVVPLRVAPGLQNKILEAMAAGVPVVSSPEAIAGIAASPDEEVLVAGNPTEFAHKVVHLLGNSPRRLQMAAKARKLVAEQYNWQQNLSQLDRIIERVVSKVL